MNNGYQNIFMMVLLLINGLILNDLYFHFYNCRYACRVNAIVKVLFGCLFSVLCVWLYFQFGYLGYWIANALVYMSIRIFYHFESKNEYFTQITFLGVMILSFLFSGFFTGFIVESIGMGKNSTLELRYFSVVLNSLLIIVLYCFLNMRMVGVSYAHLNKKELLIYLGSLVFSWILCGILIAFLIYFQDLLFQFFVCVSILFVLILDIFLFNGVQEKANNHKLEKDMELINQKSELFLKYYENVEKREEENRIFRHDLKNHLSIIKENIPQEMDGYVDDLLLHVNKENICFYSSNKVLEALINDKRELARNHNVDLDVKCDDTHIGLLSDYDLVTVLANLIDNAIEATLSLDAENRYIQLRIRDIKENLVIRIQNPYLSLNPKPGHSGLGLKSVRAVVKKYQGEMHIETKDCMFSVLILIPFHT